MLTPYVNVPAANVYSKRLLKYIFYFSTDS